MVPPEDPSTQKGVDAQEASHSLSTEWTVTMNVKKMCGISEIFSPTNNQHTRFHSANHWINMAVRSLTAIEKYLDDLDENDVCNYQLEGQLVDHKMRV